MEKGSIDAVVSMVPDISSLKELYKGENSPLPYCKPNALWIDCSSIGVLSAKEMANLIQPDGLRFVDAPVSGGVNGAKTSTLSFMVGAENEEVYNETLDVIQNMGKFFFNCDGISNGQAVKLCNNLALGIQMRSITESMRMGKKLGIDQKLITEVLSVSSSK
jgi:3-hydroxyisobutyrate dehydrogenase